MANDNRLYEVLDEIDKYLDKNEIVDEDELISENVIKAIDEKDIEKAIDDSFKDIEELAKNTYEYDLDNPYGLNEDYEYRFKRPSINEFHYDGNNIWYEGQMYDPYNLNRIIGQKIIEVIDEARTDKEDYQ